MPVYYLDTSALVKRYALVELHAVRSAMRLPPLVFLSDDDDQLKAAVREGLSSENPNDHVS